MLQDSLQFLKGVGPHKAKLLSRIGLNSIRDLLCYFPKEYDDRRNVTRSRFSLLKERITVSGRVVTAANVLKLAAAVFQRSRWRSMTAPASRTPCSSVNRTRTTATILCRRSRNKFKPGSTVIVNGKAF